MDASRANVKVAEVGETPKLAGGVKDHQDSSSPSQGNVTKGVLRMKVDFSGMMKKIRFEDLDQFTEEWSARCASKG